MVKSAYSLTDVPKKLRRQLEELLYERAVLGYSFSYEKLWEHISKEDLASCVCATTDEENKALKSELNLKIIDLMISADIVDSDGKCTMLYQDPFGTQKDFILMEGTSTSFSKSAAMDILVRKFGVDASQVQAAFDEATSSTKYNTLQARTHKEGKGGKRD